MLKDSIILTFSKGIRGILVLIFNMIISRLFTENLYGTYKQMNLIVTILTTICTIGIPVSISFFYPIYNHKNREKLLGNTVVTLLVLSVISSLLVIFFKDIIKMIFSNEDLILYIKIISAYVFIMIFSSFLENLYISSGKSVLLGKIYICYVVINFVVIVSSVLLTKNLYLIMEEFVLIEVIRTIVMIILILRYEKIKLLFDKVLLMEQLKFALPLGVVSIVQNINNYLDNLFISSNYTPAEYAGFANGAADIPMVGIVTISIAAVVLPKMSQEYNKSKDSKKLLSIWGKSCEETALIMFPIFWIVSLFSIGYIDLIYSEKYIEASTPIFLIYLLKYPLYCTVFGNVLIVLEKQKYIMINSLIGICINIVLNFMFIKFFGIIGPAISTVLVQYLVVYLQLKEIGRGCNLKIRNLMPYKKLIKIFLVPSIIAIPIYLISRLIMLRDSASFLIFGVVIYILSIIIYYKMGYIKIDELPLLRQKKERLHNVTE